MKKPRSKAKNKKQPVRQPRADLEFYSAAQKKNLDNIKLLVSYPLFQKEVTSIREYLDIPAGGFGDNYEKSKQWHEKILKLSDEISNTKSFFAQEDKIRQKLKNKEIEYRMAKKQMCLHWHKAPCNYLTDSVEFLTKKFNLPLHYDSFLRNYIISGTLNPIYMPLDNFTIGSFPGSVLLREVRYVPVTIYAKLTDVELADIKKAVNEFNENLPQFQPLKNIDDKLTLEEWFLNREGFDELEQEKYKTTAGEMAKETFGSLNKRNKKKIYDSIKELKELREKRFGK